MLAKIDIINNQLNNEKSMLKDQERKNNEMENELIRLRNEVKILKQQK